MSINQNQTDNHEQAPFDISSLEPEQLCGLQFNRLKSKLGFGFKPHECSSLLDKDGHLLAMFANSEPKRTLAIFARGQDPLWYAKYEDLEDAELFVDDQVVIKGQTLMQFLDYAGDLASFFPIAPVNKIFLGVKDLLIKLSPNIKSLRRINKTVYLRVKTSNQNIPPFNLQIISEPMKIEESYLDQISKFADKVESTIDSICAEEKKKLMEESRGTIYYNIEHAEITLPNPAPNSSPSEYQHQPGYQSLQSNSLREKFEQQQREKKEPPHPGDLWGQTF